MKQNEILTSINERSEKLNHIILFPLMLAMLIKMFISADSDHSCNKKKMIWRKIQGEKLLQERTTLKKKTCWHLLTNHQNCHKVLNKNLCNPGNKK